ncbi:hypothetical protein EWM62_04205 [Mucilaginibacter terrigena]|uniref:Lipoprotein n=1 Tax=Mucilaginibacter terrigena TaxID=2492395 RepID=A0A4Q5LP40_9SPHI|nr:hypothetical protein [Mucilaginibacter terrigena]RYU91151.1 hypothetical protein EWM62_04205 [Mucilaginibacter terrigena]
MKKPALISTFSALLVIILSACNPKADSPAKQSKTDIPEPLEESGGDVLSFKRYASDNMVNAIYLDLVKKTSDLQSLEAQLGKFNEGKPDSLVAFNNYAAKVESYYSSANQNLERIEDPILKERLKTLLAAEKGKYALKANEFEILIKDIDSQNFAIKDYYETLKIVATLPVIVKYQNNNIPDVKRVKAVDEQAKSLKSKTIKLGKKYGGAGVIGN